MSAQAAGVQAQPFEMEVIAALGASNIPADRLHEATSNDMAEEYII